MTFLPKIATFFCKFRFIAYICSPIAEVAKW